MQHSSNPSFPSIFKPDKKFTHSEEALHALKEVSLKMKNNFGKFGKHIKNITRSDKVLPTFNKYCNRLQLWYFALQEEGKTLLSSISTQLMYIILNSHQPLQMKMDELFIKIHDKMKNTLNVRNNILALHSTYLYILYNFLCSCILWLPFHDTGALAFVT